MNGARKSFFCAAAAQKKDFLAPFILALSALSCTVGRQPSPPSAWTATGPGTWSFTLAEDRSRLVRVDAEHGEERDFNVLLSSERYGPDVELSTRLHADSGETERGGGLVWRAVDARNYYLARWNPLEDNLRLYKVEDGDRRLLVTLDTDVPDDAWHELRAKATGTRILVVLDSKYAISFDDATFTAAGSVGLWSKADASTAFTPPAIRRS